MARDLKAYHRKRDFQHTPEPRGKALSKRSGHSFVIQKHAARRLHYDFRLELNGALVSWAVPKGPSLDPKEKRLAVRVEDHPLEYGGFEGIIPEGQYGGGTVLLWDRGTWLPDGDPVAGLRKGRLKFQLKGKKLRGAWMLVRLKQRESDSGKENWLLIKDRDREAIPSSRQDILKERPESVKSGRQMDEVAKSKRKWISDRPHDKSENGNHIDVSRLSGVRKAKLPERISPQLATLADQPPEGNAWLHEIKLDGYRVLCKIENKKASFFTRQGRDRTHWFDTLSEAVTSLPVRQALMDGEVVVLNEDGSTSFQALQNALDSKEASGLVYFVFDLIHLNEYDLSLTPLLERKKLLASLLNGAGTQGPIRFNDHVIGHGKNLYQSACRFTLEGIISKRKDQPYKPGRGRDWLKVKCIKRQEFVIGGYTDTSWSKQAFGALLLGVHDRSGHLRYTGRVGTGFTNQSNKDLRARLERIAQKSPSFTNPPPAARGVHWVKPKLVVEVSFSEWTQEGLLRQPSFKGLRDDKPAAKVMIEKPLPTQAVSASPAVASRHGNGGTEVAGVHLTHPDRVIYPEQKITKLELALFYEKIADWILPHLTGRPLTLVRCPGGWEKECFYQKHLNETVPDAVKTVPIKEGGKTSKYLTIDSLPGLISLVQMGVLEIHTWGSQNKQVERPDRLTFDIDPDPAIPWPQVIEAARKIKERLRDQGLEAFVKTTGGKGLHVVVPIMPKNNWEEVKEFSKLITQSIVQESPERYIATMSKAKRKCKIYIDYLRNASGATAVAAYSTRARRNAPVSVPLRWDELKLLTRPDQFNLHNLPERLSRLRSDPWKDYEAGRRPIRLGMKKKF